MPYEVQIIERKTECVLKRIGGAAGLRGAEKIQKGININLNHLDYKTKIVEVERSDIKTEQQSCKTASGSAGDSPRSD